MPVVIPDQALPELNSLLDRIAHGDAVKIINFLNAYSVGPQTQPAKDAVAQTDDSTKPKKGKP